MQLLDDNDRLTYDPFTSVDELNDPDNRCEHGVFTGNAHGGDFMCGDCEMGTTPEEFAQRRAYDLRRDEAAYGYRLLAAALTHETPHFVTLDRARETAFWVDVIAGTKEARDEFVRASDEDMPLILVGMRKEA